VLVNIFIEGTGTYNERKLVGWYMQGKCRRAEKGRKKLLGHFFKTLLGLLQTEKLTVTHSPIFLLIKYYEVREKVFELHVLILRVCLNQPNICNYPIFFVI
jgi:cell division protein FtsL